eukprot:1648764-Rhodomonas_salina.1
MGAIDAFEQEEEEAGDVARAEEQELQRDFEVNPTTMGAIDAFEHEEDAEDVARTTWAQEEKEEEEVDGEGNPSMGSYQRLRV